MKIYFRLLSFARPIEKYAVPYFIAVVLYTVFNTLNLALLAPVLTTLFSENIHELRSYKPNSALDIMGYFNYYTGYFINKYGPGYTLKYICAVIGVSVLLSNIFRYLSQLIIENLRIHTLFNLRTRIFNNVMDLHISYFSNERKGDIIAKIASDVQTVQFTVTSTLQVIFKEPLQMAAYIFMLFSISYKLTLFSILIVPISAFVIARIVKRLKEQALLSQKSYGIMISYIDEALSGIKILKAFGAISKIKQKFRGENEYYSRIMRSMILRQQLASPISEFMGVIMVLVIVLYGGSLILNKSSELSASEFIAYVAIFSQVMRPAKAITDAFSSIHNGLAAGERVLDMIDTKPDIQDKSNPIVLNNFEKEISIENVWFSYKQKPNILQNINIKIPKGKTTALVGPSGGGKSTLMDLIPRFIEPDSGEIKIDGYNIRDVSIESLRKLMGFVNQESILFNDTIFNNIALGKPDAALEEVIEAAKTANAHNFIKDLEHGYDSNIGDRGMKLSGGQKQRICIARAVLANTPIMLLDEATSALDTESEKLVQEALNNLTRSRTSLIIAHRLSTVISADHIIVLDGGRIVEEGNHEKLIKAKGLYARLVNMQNLGS